jgi:hypothetical protein
LGRHQQVSLIGPKGETGFVGIPRPRALSVTIFEDICVAHSRQHPTKENKVNGVTKIHEAANSESSDNGTIGKTRAELEDANVRFVLDENDNVIDRLNP